MATAKQIINSIKPKKDIFKAETPRGEIGYDNQRDDIEKIKNIREGTIQKVPANNDDIANKKFVDDSFIKRKYKQVVISDYTVLDDDGYEVFCFECGAAARTLTLPTYADNIGRIIKVFRADSQAGGSLTIVPEGAETIDGQASIALPKQYEVLVLIAQSDEWIILDKYYYGLYKINELLINNGDICVFNTAAKDIRTSNQTIVTTLGADDTTVPTSKAVADVIKPKQYLGGTTYNGVALTVAGTNGTLVRAVFIPYQLSDDTWRLRFNLAMTFTAAGSGTTITVAGITAKNVASYYQSIAAMVVTTNARASAAITPNTNQIVCYTSAGTVYAFQLSGDIELESKPTWAD